jgi:site-specific DNA-cytosine methylase
MTFTYIDLFAGAGGLSVGFGNAGFDLIFANDYAPDAVRTFRYNLKRLHPEMKYLMFWKTRISDHFFQKFMRLMLFVVDHLARASL